MVIGENMGMLDYLCGKKDKKKSLVKQIEEASIQSDPIDILKTPGEFERFVLQYKFRRFPVSQIRSIVNDFKYDTDVLLSQEGIIVALPENRNFYTRNYEQEAYGFSLLGMLYIKVKGEFLLFQPENAFETVKYFDYRGNWKSIMASQGKPFIEEGFIDLNSLEKRIAFIEIIKEANK